MDITLILHFSHTLFCKLPKTITFDKARKTIKTNVAVMFLGNGTLTFYIKSILTLKEKNLKTQPWHRIKIIELIMRVIKNVIK